MTELTRGYDAEFCGMIDSPSRSLGVWRLAGGSITTFQMLLICRLRLSPACAMVNLAPRPPGPTTPSCSSILGSPTVAQSASLGKDPCDAEPLS